MLGQDAVRAEVVTEFILGKTAGSNSAPEVHPLQKVFNLLCHDKPEAENTKFPERKRLMKLSPGEFQRVRLCTGHTAHIIMQILALLVGTRMAKLAANFLRMVGMVSRQIKRKSDMIIDKKYDRMNVALHNGSDPTSPMEI